MQILPLKLERTLESNGPLYKDGPKYLSAASGLQKVGDDLLVVADDAVHLGVYHGDGPGELFPLLPQQEPLPFDAKARKKLKPDFESLARLGSETVAVGSGSLPQTRNTGVVFRYTSENGPSQPVAFDLNPLYQHLLKDTPELNIEGLALLPELNVVRLAHRGPHNLLVDLDLNQAMEAARAGQPWTPEMITEVRPLELGSLDKGERKVPLSITDLNPLPGGKCVFTAAAEDTDNPVDDGEVLGSAIGILAADGTVESVYLADKPVKLEGVAATPVAGGLDLRLVTDGDDPSRKAELFSAYMPYQA